ncbi:hypothetical protein ACFQBQ_01165 [Granulicella cerasi]|uniref:Uncharacterized protein n=1 Tax=Granulicella cerasi TaxID=741063 RepID=A0ABW1Z4B5_9BACT
MTREEAIALRPASRVTYWTSLVAAALIVALGLDWSFFVKRLSIFGELASVAVIAGYSVLGLQAYLRLFRPEVSAKIALRFSLTPKPGFAKSVSPRSSSGWASPSSACRLTIMAGACWDGESTR